MNTKEWIRTVAVVVAALGVTMSHATAAEPDQKPTPQPRESVLTLNKEFACCDYGGNKVCIVNREGTITWQMQARNPQDIWVLPDGTILFTHVKGVKRVTRDKKIVWEYKADSKCEIHAAQPLPDDKCMIAESGPMRIIEVDRSGTITKEVKLTTRSKSVHGQMRGARKLANGNYLVGQYAEGVLREYDAAGKIVWKFKQKPVFGGIRLTNGNTIVSTGDGHRIAEVNKAGTIVWEIKEKDLPGNPLRFIAGMQLLPNGNLVVCNWGGHGHTREQPQIFEVTRAKKVVGVIDDWKHFGTLSGVCIMGLKGDPTRFEIAR